MIFAAGLGTRLKPLTDHMPKALVPVNGRPILEHVILKLKQSNSTNWLSTYIISENRSSTFLKPTRISD